MRTRAQHVAWCKQRALEYVERGQFSDAVASMLSDLGKHEETVPGLAIAATALAIRMDDPESVRHWIEGFAE